MAVSGPVRSANDQPIKNNLQCDKSNCHKRSFNQDIFNQLWTKAVIWTQCITDQSEIRCVGD